MTAVMKLDDIHDRLADVLTGTLSVEDAQTLRALINDCYSAPNLKRALRTQPVARTLLDALSEAVEFALDVEAFDRE